MAKAQIQPHIKIGLQTIAWGPSPKDLGEVFSCARDLGCEGIELAQGVDVVGGPKALAEQLARQKLTLAGLAGGSLASRLSHALALRPDYLYADEWDELAIGRAIQSGLQVALHPHYCKRMDKLSLAASYLERSQQLHIILDTAHQYLSGDNVVEAFQMFSGRVAAIHLKDWRPRYGKSPQRFAQGFTFLGNGILGEAIERIVTMVLSSGYSGWLILEQDSTPGEPCQYIKRSREWIRALGI